MNKKCNNHISVFAPMLEDTKHVLRVLLNILLLKKREKQTLCTANIQLQNRNKKGKNTNNPLENPWL